jgi:hypothetical protein
MGKKIITLDVDIAEEIIGDLSFLVTSIDRLGSARLPKAVELEWLDGFMTDGDVFRRLAQMRKMISLALDGVLTDDELEAMNTRLGEIKPWPLP